MHKTIILHNKAINYRLPLFERLKSELNDAVKIWFYHETDKNFPEAEYFSFFNLGKLKLSLAVIWGLLVRDYGAAVLWGSHSLETILGFLVLKLRGKQIIFWTETWDWGDMSAKDKFYFFWIKLIARHASICLYPGKQVKKLYESLGVPGQRIAAALDASENDTTIHADFQATVPVDSTKHQIVFMGRALERKGVEYLVDAMQYLDLSKFELLIALGNGNDEYKQKILQKAQQFENIKIRDFVPKEYAASFLSLTDVFVYPSVSPQNHPHGEPWGLVLNEAVSLGLPIVSTDMVAAAYDLIIEGKNGFMVQQKDATALAEAIRKCVELDKSQLDKTSRDLAKQYSYDAMATGFIEAIKKLKEDKNV